MPKLAYQVITPERRRTSVVFASPHSGRDYPWSFVRKSVLDGQMIRSSEDAFVDDLFAAAPSFGAPLLKACAPRAFIDYNRSADELDPALIDGMAKGKALNPRVASGLGVVPRVVAGGRAIYRGKMPMSEAQRRTETYWQPYHQKLQELLGQFAFEPLGELLFVFQILGRRNIFGHLVLMRQSLFVEMERRGEVQDRPPVLHRNNAAGGKAAAVIIALDAVKHRRRRISRTHEIGM